MIDYNCCRESMNPFLIPRLLKFRIDFRREHPDYFDPDGLVIFVGGQGTGKTLSAVNYVYKLMAAYPPCKLVTNVELRDFPIVTFENWLAVRELPEEDLDPEELEKRYFRQYVQENQVFEFRDNDDFARYFNGEFGVIFLVDEIQLYLSSLESKNINIEVVTQISQQRKQRKHIVATSQVFGRMAKPLREQFSCVMACKSYLGETVQCNRLLDRDSLATEESTGTNLSGEVVKKFWYVRQPEMFARYDTYRVIERGKFASGEKQKNIYEPEPKGPAKKGKEKNDAA